MLKAIINLINALADRVRPCKHDWELLQKMAVLETEEASRYEASYTKWTYRCTKCCESKIISSK